MPKHTVAVQTSPGHCSAQGNFSLSLVHSIQPEHFTTVQICKLEDAFRQNTKPDTVTMQILAMESNLLYCDVVAWFRERRLKWVEDAEKFTTKSVDRPADTKTTDENLPDVQC